MDEQNCELLFEYLRSILYDSEVQPLDIESLDEPYRKLGKGLQYLDEAVQEMKAYSADLSKGNLSGPVPSRENFLCENLKNIHASLAHLTWQAKQVAKGDYSQKVSFLGEFSEAFNTMTAQLMEREKVLKEEAEREKCLLEQQAHFDKLTQIGNRHYFYLKVDELLNTGEALTFCYCDLDHLKYINDTYGHTEGDEYLCSFVRIVKSLIREDDLFVRMGGDEFCMVFKNCAREVVDEKLKQMQEKFRVNGPVSYDRNFSYGVLQIPENHEKTDIEMIIQEVDCRMYEQKKKHHSERLQ